MHRHSLSLREPMSRFDAAANHNRNLARNKQLDHDPAKPNDPRLHWVSNSRDPVEIFRREVDVVPGQGREHAVKEQHYRSSDEHSPAQRRTSQVLVLRMMRRFVVRVEGIEGHHAQVELVVLC